MTKEYQEVERRLREQAEPVGDVDLRARVARLEGEKAAKDAVLEGVQWRCRQAAGWPDEVAKRLAEDLLGVLARIAPDVTGVE